MAPAPSVTRAPRPSARAVRALLAAATLAACRTVAPVPAPAATAAPIPDAPRPALAPPADWKTDGALTQDEGDARCRKELPACARAFGVYWLPPSPCANQGTRCMETPDLSQGRWSCGCDLCAGKLGMQADRALRERRPSVLERAPAPALHRRTLANLSRHRPAPAGPLTAGERQHRRRPGVIPFPAGPATPVRSRNLAARRAENRDRWRVPSTFSSSTRMRRAMSRCSTGCAGSHRESGGHWASRCSRSFSLRVRTSSGPTLARWIGGGIFEFRLDQDAAQVLQRKGKKATPEDAEPSKILLRVFCHAHGQKIVLLLAGYDKAGRPGARHQNEQIQLAKLRLKDWRARQGPARTG